jgi:hypothetical protein
MIHSEQGAIVISIILGLGLAALFRKACADNSCIVIKGPNIKETQSSFYKINDSCYKYEAVAAECK